MSESGLGNMEQSFSKTAYLDLQALAAYSCCSVRWLRDRLRDRTHSLPCYRVEGKVLVKIAEFDEWMAGFRKYPQPQDLDQIVDDVVSSLCAREST